MDRGAVVLCGGRSRRMGLDKARLPFGGETMLRRVVRQLQRDVDRVVVVAAQGQDLPSLPNPVLVVRDTRPGLGPLQGLVDGLLAMHSGVELVYATSTDAPFLAAGWIDRLAELIGDHDLAIVERDGFLQPLAALYRREPSLHAARRMLDQGRSRLAELSATLRSIRVDASLMRAIDPDLTTLSGFNTMQEYRRLVLDNLGLAPDESGGG